MFNSEKIWQWVSAITIFFYIWWIGAFIFQNPFIPNPFEVIFSSVNLFQSGEIFVHIWGSVRRTVFGFLLSLLIASLLGYVVGVSSFLKNYVSPIIELLRPIPPIAWIPMSILWFGIGDASSLFIIFLAAFFPIFTSVSFGVASLPEVYNRVSIDYDLTVYQKFIHIIFPFSLPYLFSGCKVSIGFAWMAVIAAEMIAVNSGLGYFIEINRVLLKTQYVIFAMIVIGLIGYVMNKIISYLEFKVVVWKQ